VPQAVRLSDVLNCKLLILLFVYVLHVLSVWQQQINNIGVLLLFLKLLCFRDGVFNYEWCSNVNINILHYAWCGNVNINLSGLTIHTSIIQYVKTLSILRNTYISNLLCPYISFIWRWFSTYDNVFQFQKFALIYTLMLALQGNCLLTSFI
jgi:hypothetical protein